MTAAPAAIPSPLSNSAFQKGPDVCIYSAAWQLSLTQDLCIGSHAPGKDGFILINPKLGPPTPRFQSTSDIDQLCNFRRDTWLTTLTALWIQSIRGTAQHTEDTTQEAVAGETGASGV